MSIKQKLRVWLGISRIEQSIDCLDRDLLKQSKRISRKIDELDKLTEVDIDVGVRGPCTVILSGVWRGKGYVQFYEVDHDEFRHIVEEYQSRRRSGHLRNIDSIPQYRGGSFELF